MRYANVVTFEVRGDYALFSDPITRVGGEKISYQIPTYEAIKGVLDSVYWKPTIIWVIDEVRVMNQIKTEAKAIRTLSYTRNTPDLSYYTYLNKVVYQVNAHFEWNMNRPELEKDRNEDKHYQMAQRMIKKGGRRDVFLGTRECQAYVSPISFGEGEGYYDKSGTLSFGFMYHGIIYPDESSEEKGMIINFWNSRMVDGVIKYPRPSECEFRKVVDSKNFKKFEEGINFSILTEVKGDD